jgi:hypothetical protein
VLAEKESSFRLEHPAHLPQGLTTVGDGAEGEGQQHGIDAFVLQRNLSGRPLNPSDLDRGSPQVFPGQSAHSSLDLAERHPWESLERHFSVNLYEEYFCGFVYLSVGAVGENET